MHLIPTLTHSTLNYFSNWLIDILHSFFISFYIFLHTNICPINQLVVLSLSTLLTDNNKKLQYLIMKVLTFKLFCCWLLFIFLFISFQDLRQQNSRVSTAKKQALGMRVKVRELNTSLYIDRTAQTNRKIYCECWFFFVWMKWKWKLVVNVNFGSGEL